MELKQGYKQTELGILPNEWNVCNLNQITDAKRSICYGIVQTGRPVTNGIRCVRVVDITNGRVNPKNLITTSAEISASYKRTVLSTGDLVIALRGKIGELAVADNDLAGANLTRGVAIIPSSSEFDSAYLCHYLCSPLGKQTLERNLNGSALQEIPIATLRLIPAVIPPLPEQRAIAAALSDMDALLAAQDQLIAKKRDIKQAMMQQLLTGKQRLPGFSGEWDVKRLGEIASMGSGGTPPSKIASYYDGNIPWVSVADMTSSGKYVYKTERNLSQQGLQNSSAQLFPTATILYAMYASIGECSIAAVEVCSSQAILGIRVGDKLIADYLYFHLASKKAQVKEMGQQGTQSNINKGIVENFKISLPTIDEQAAIAAVLSDMDAEIDALQQRRDKTRALKQGMMQELLTGRTRLV